MPWVIGAAIVGSALLSSSASSDASAGQADAANQATAANSASSASSIEEQRREYDIGQQTLQDQAARDQANYERQYADTKSNFERQYGDTRADYERARGDAAPYREAGTSALASLKGMLASGSPAYKPFTLDDFWSDPVTKASYQSGLDLGKQAIENMARSRGGANSGATLKALDRFGTDYTGQQASASQGRFVGEQNRQAGVYGDQFNRTATVASMGAGPSPGATYGGTNYSSGPGSGNAQAQAQLGASNANTIGNIMTGTAGANANLLTGAANARGAAAIGGANAFSGATSSLANYWSGQQNLDKILNRSSGYTPDYAGASVNYSPAYYGGYE